MTKAYILISGIRLLGFWVVRGTAKERKRARFHNRQWWSKNTQGNHAHSTQ